MEIHFFLYRFVKRMLQSFSGSNHNGGDNPSWCLCKWRLSVTMPLISLREVSTLRTWCLNLNSLANNTFHCLQSHLPFREIIFPLIISVFWKDRLHTRTFREKAKEHRQKSLSKNIFLKLVVNYSWNLFIILKYLIK